MSRVVVVDVETSGVNPFMHEVLALALIEVGGERRSCEVFVRPPRDVQWSGIALKYFDGYRRAWEAKALQPSDALTQVERFLQDVGGGQAVSIAGHNVGFDVAFMRKLAFDAGASEVAGASHRLIDVHTVLWLLVRLGRIPVDAVSSSRAFEHFGISIEAGSRHTALGDAQATADLLEAALSKLDCGLDVGRRH